MLRTSLCFHPPRPQEWRVSLTALRATLHRACRTMMTSAKTGGQHPKATLLVMSQPIFLQTEQVKHNLQTKQIVLSVCDYN